MDKLQPASVFSEIIKERTGLIVGTGGSGKTTTLAALLNEINQQVMHRGWMPSRSAIIRPRTTARKWLPLASAEPAPAVAGRLTASVWRWRKDRSSAGENSAR